MASRGRAVVACLCCALLALGGCGSPGGARPSPEPPGSTALRIAAVGDSITDANSPDFAGGELGEESWVSHAVGDGVAFAGGWAQWGATTAQMAAGAQPVDADVLVVLAGTNDVTAGIPFDETAANIAEIAATVDAPRVLISAVPPIDPDPALATELNANLEALAVAREWEFVDAPAEAREGDRFAPGMSEDGVHPTAQGARVIGAAVRAALVAE
ncbi:SGNH/GDSL hydrolase family protein [Georgenia sp. 10Sc9-8]|uniref:SGNH/GDSL hydrolase family protein n=1 Tax=Georgenia halotolerans TaxID=3028317 RepID=A0ABT5U1F1_9MICO|nr:SGNH/GDSL hydrolase family protein [Georgenia halotolerans]